MDLRIKIPNLGLNYRINGAIYIINKEKLLLEKTSFLRIMQCHTLCREDSIDIDTRFDFEVAEFLMKKINETYCKT